jgi:molybdopterin/thiamine biosynthesis adenylyltransferase
VDPAPTRLCDTGVNFFLSEADVGLPRAEAVLPRLHELNPLCKLKLADQLTEAVIRSHKVLIITEPRPLTDLIALNELCRSINVAFYYAFVGGMCMSVFVDLGLKHTIFDPKGEVLEELTAERPTPHHEVCQGAQLLHEGPAKHRRQLVVAVAARLSVRSSRTGRGQCLERREVQEARDRGELAYT